MRRRLRFLAILLAASALPGVARAQSSASFRQSEHVLNLGGRPSGGVSAASATFRVSLDAIGESIAIASISGASFRVGAGFLVPYIPPAEVMNLLLQSDKQTLTWDVEKSAARYALYRAALTQLSGLQYGACLGTTPGDPTAVDAEVPALMTGYYYLVTAGNLLNEEGTKGFDSEAFERANPAPCP